MLFRVRSWVIYPLDLNTPNSIKPLEKDHLIINIVGISLSAFSKDLGPNFKMDKGLLNPSYIDYLSPGDMETHWLGWLYFRHTPFFQFPLLSNFSYGLENWSATIIHTDSLPIMALLFRPFSSYLPQLFQYFGYWIYLCFLFQGFCSYYLINCLLYTSPSPRD